jgi:hypothetical protein
MMQKQTGMNCSTRQPTEKQLRYLRSLARRQLWTLKPSEVCCGRHVSETIDMLLARRVPHGWDRRSRAGNRRYRQG